MWKKLDNFERKVFIISLLIHLLTAYFSVGYHQPDEYFQVYEFAAWKLGFAPAAELPWEFGAQIRGTIQPLLVYAISQFLLVFNAFQPAWVALFFRTISALGAWWASILLYDIAKLNLATQKLDRFLLLSSVFLWFLTYQSVRFSSENWSALFLIFGLYLLLKSKSKLNLAYLMAGVLFGISFLFRFQIAFALLGLGAWLLFIQKTTYRLLFNLIFGGILSLLLGLLIDRWFYGNWVFTPYNYFVSNILDGNAANFGVTPWYDYFWQIFLTAVPPISIAILFLAAWAMVKNPKNIFVWIVATFFLAHSSVGHKELRFLFPIAIFIPIMMCLALKDNLVYNFIFRYKKWAYAIIVVPNFILFLVVTFRPADEKIIFYDYVYQQSKCGKLLMLFEKSNPFDALNLKIHFQKHQNTVVKKLTSNDDLCRNNADYSAVMLFKMGVNAPEIAICPGVVGKLVYRNIPLWLTYFNFNDWVGRSNVWSLYLVTPSLG